ncbi:HD-GYP domain-containing protein [Fundidesulfovibrio magnetotacticus]|nr:HD-GYP domain-containing protein [Fundidesulfovibrio magnetotacticus]
MASPRRSAPCAAELSPSAGSPERIRKIAVAELRPGMTVVDTGLSWTEHPFLYSAAGPVDSRRQVEALLAEGYRETFIREERTPAPPRRSGMSPSSRPLPGRDDYARARALQDESVGVISAFMRAARLGKPLDREAPARLVEKVIDTVAGNPDALVSLANLRRNDAYSYTHSLNVSVLAVVFGQYLGLDKDALRGLGEAGLFHDLGKTRIPDAILDKPGRLTPEEFAVIKSHPGEGADILESQGLGSPKVLAAIRDHHEKFNGAGYPRGLAGDRLERAAQVVGLVDSYDAMTSNRPYRGAIQPNTAMRILFAMRDKDFSRELLESFIKCLGIYPVGSPVRLRDGSVALVCGSNPESPLLPTVKIILDARMRPRPHLVLDLASPQVKALGDAVVIEAPLDMSVLGMDPAGFLF